MKGKNVDTVEIRRARRGWLRRNQFRVVLVFADGKEFAHTETYSNHSYAASLGSLMAAKLAWRYMDRTGIPRG